MILILTLNQVFSNFFLSENLICELIWNFDLICWKSWFSANQDQDQDLDLILQILFLSLQTLSRNQSKSWALQSEFCNQQHLLKDTSNKKLITSEPCKRNLAKGALQKEPCKRNLEKGALQKEPCKRNIEKTLTKDLWTRNIIQTQIQTESKANLYPFTRVLAQQTKNNLRTNK